MTEQGKFLNQKNEQRKGKKDSNKREFEIEDREFRYLPLPHLPCLLSSLERKTRGRGAISIAYQAIWQGKTRKRNEKK